MHKFLVFSRLICTCALLLSFVSCQKQNASPEAEQSFAPNFTLAKTNNELAAIQADPAANIVRTRQDLDALISSNKSPLIKLSAADRADFLDKLVFRENVGVVSFYYGDVAAKLSYDDLAQVVAAFGLDAKQGFWGLSQDPAINQQLQGGGTTEPSFMADHIRYRCIGPHNCLSAAEWICTSNC
jgi:hypothetical protein